jgi:hypothetical protein
LRDCTHCCISRWSATVSTGTKFIGRLDDAATAVANDYAINGVAALDVGSIVSFSGFRPETGHAGAVQRGAAEPVQPEQRGSTIRRGSRISPRARSFACSI